MSIEKFKFTLRSQVILLSVFQTTFYETLFVVYFTADFEVAPLLPSRKTKGRDSSRSFLHYVFYFIKVAASPVIMEAASARVVPPPGRRVLSSYPLITCSPVAHFIAVWA